MEIFIKITNKIQCGKRKKILTIFKVNLINVILALGSVLASFRITLCKVKV